VNDLRNNTVYSGGLRADHPTVHDFWEVVGDMTHEERHALVKFVTSCRSAQLHKPLRCCRQSAKLCVVSLLSFVSSVC
jgi:hypothetical protein